jgi:hypothetical protein
MRRRILFASLVTLVVVGALLGLRIPSAHATTATSIAPPLSGTSYTINNGPGDQVFPRVSGNWAVYFTFDGQNRTVHYHNLTTGADATIPNPGSPNDLMPAISGTMVVFTRVTFVSVSPFAHTAIYSYDIATNGPAVELTYALRTMPSHMIAPRRVGRPTRSFAVRAPMRATVRTSLRALRVEFSRLPWQTGSRRGAARAEAVDHKSGVLCR